MARTAGTLGKAGLLYRLLLNLKLIIPLIRDYWTGKYRKIPLLSIIGIFFTAFYLINPLDLIPEPVVFGKLAGSRQGIDFFGQHSCSLPGNDILESLNLVHA